MIGESEKDVEKYLIAQVKEMGGLAYKFVSPQRRSVPDRVCVFPTGIIVFVECKGDFGVLSKGQIREIKRLIDLGASTQVVRNKQDVNTLIDAVQEGMNLRRQT